MSFFHLGCYGFKKYNTKKRNLKVEKKFVEYFLCALYLRFHGRLLYGQTKQRREGFSYKYLLIKGRKEK